MLKMQHLRFSSAKAFQGRAHRAPSRRQPPFCSGAFGNLARHLLENIGTGPTLKVLTLLLQPKLELYIAYIETCRWSDTERQAELLLAQLLLRLCITDNVPKVASQ